MYAVTLIATVFVLQACGAMQVFAASAASEDRNETSTCLRIADYAHPFTVRDAAKGLTKAERANLKVVQELITTSPYQRAYRKEYDLPGGLPERLYVLRGIIGEPYVSLFVPTVPCPGECTGFYAAAGARHNPAFARPFRYRETISVNSGQDLKNPRFPLRWDRIELGGQAAGLVYGIIFSHASAKDAELFRSRQPGKRPSIRSDAGHASDAKRILAECLNTTGGQ